LLQNGTRKTARIEALFGRKLYCAIHDQVNDQYSNHCHNYVKLVRHFRLYIVGLKMTPVKK